MDRRCSDKDFSSDDESRSGLTQMIIKLRWIGLEDEAKQLELEARRLPPEQRSGVSFGPFSTD